MLTLLLLLSNTAMAAETKEPVALSQGERESLYEDHGMNYAKGLYLEMSGTPEDEARSKKGEVLNYKIRERGINKLQASLAKTKDVKIRKEILFRLSQLFEQQAEIISRRSDLSSKEIAYNESLRSSNKYLTLLRKEYPTWTPDAILFNLAENHTKLKEAPQAEIFYREIISKYPKSSVVADSLLSLGNLYFDRKGFETAKTFYRRILDTPEVNLHPYGHYKMAWCDFNQHNFHGAVGGLEKAILESRKLQQSGEKKLGVEDEALSDLILFYAEDGNPDEAKDHIERLVSKEKANELRYNLARRYFEYGKHLMAKNVAKQLLSENPQKEYVNKLYLILISVAEKTKDREFGLQTAEKLSGWLKDEKLASNDTGRIETEEYMRLYSERLHHEAETMKQKEVWTQAKKSYEIYLQTFPEETETPEVKFRFAVLLMNRKDQLKAYQTVSESIAKMDKKHPRFKEAQKLRIQSIELATADERKKISDKELLAAYDSYATNFPDEDLGIEAKYKAANLAKNIETPEQAAARFRAIAEAHPEHNLAKASVSEALAILVKAQKWEALNAESKHFERADAPTALLEKNEELRKKISEARELSSIKITEELESQGKLEEAKVQYEKILSDNPSETLGIFCLVRLASLTEQKMQRNRDAIEYFKQLKEKYPSSKEAKQAPLEIGRLYEKVNAPKEAVVAYKEYAAQGNGKLELQALTNAAVILENLGERELAASTFFDLSAAREKANQAPKEVLGAYEAGCNNVLLASYQNKDKKILQNIQNCAKRLKDSESGMQWQARGAWAMDQLADNLQAETTWKKIATKSVKATPDAERAYLAMAKIKILEKSLEEFKGMRFTKTNERPEANIGNKTKAMDLIEKTAEGIIKIGTSKQILATKNIVRLAYIEFAETMEAAAVPSKLSDQDKEQLKASFLTFAKDFRDRATALEVKEEKREIASTTAPAEKPAELKVGSLSSEERKLLENGQVPAERGAELYAKKAFELFQDGKYGEAKYFSEKWKQGLSGGTVRDEFNKNTWDRFQSLLTEKFPEIDPVSQEF